MQPAGWRAKQPAGYSGPSTYRRKILPLFPTLATVNCLPSRPAELPSGVISHFVASTSFLPVGFFASSPPGRLSATGTNGFEAWARDDCVLDRAGLSASWPNGSGGDRWANLPSRKLPLACLGVFGRRFDQSLRKGWRGFCVDIGGCGAGELAISMASTAFTLLHAQLIS